jgi:hypothetical protein
MKELDPLLVALLSGGLITGIIGLVGHFVNLWNTQREQQNQRATEESREQQDTLQKYIDQISDLVLNQNLRPGPDDSVPKPYVRGLAQARTLAVLTGVAPSFKRWLLLWCTS